jgi:ribosomal protein S18 acetylase RimI-like enzyme
VELRRARADDVPTLARMLRASYDAMPYLPRLYTPEEDAAYVGRMVADHEAWVAEASGRVVGFAALDDVALLQIHVDAEWQNRGVGTALFRRATERRPRGFVLWTFQKNEGARRFYERHGCRVAQLTDGARNDEREPDVQYEWRPG